MKFWTVQSTKVVDEIFRLGLYLPDFAKSSYLKLNPNLTGLYRLVLDSFNYNNSCDYNGLIFSFMKYSGLDISEIENYAEFKNLIISKEDVIQSLWNHYMHGKYAILELEYREDFSLLPIDINDFQFLMPPVIIIEPYVEGDVQLFAENISKGVMIPSPLYSGIVQVHLPYIKRENVVGIHPMFEI